MSQRVSDRMLVVGILLVVSTLLVLAFILGYAAGGAR